MITVFNKEILHHFILMKNCYRLFYLKHDSTQRVQTSTEKY